MVGVIVIFSIVKNCPKDKNVVEHKTNKHINLSSINFLSKYF
jgi:hypothetical protein